MSVDMERRVLITGAGGFIGRHCLPFLLSNGFEVHAADVSFPEETLPRVCRHQADLLDLKQAQDLIEAVRPTHLLHFAWYARPGEYWSSTENIRWVEGSLHLLRAFHQAGGRRVVMAGTCAEYDWRYGYCSEGITPLAPSTLYGTSKNALQHLLLEFSRVAGLRSAWGRVFFLYGPHEHPGRLVSSVIANLLRNEQAPCSHGSQVRDFLYVDDVASAFVSLLISEVEGPVNIASGRPVTLKEVALAAADRIGAHAGKLLRFGALPSPENEPLLIVGDCSRLALEVGWKPAHDLSAGLEKTVRFWRERGGA